MIGSQDPEISRREHGYLLVFTEVYATDVEDLWRAVTTPERLARWMTEYRGELTAGGCWEALAADGTAWGSGSVISCEPPHRFATRWQGRDEPENVLEVTLEPAEGGTRLTLRHSDVPSIYYGAGWHVYLECLAKHLADPAGDYTDEAAWDARFAELQPEYSVRFARLRPGGADAGGA